MCQPPYHSLVTNSCLRHSCHYLFTVSPHRVHCPIRLCLRPLLATLTDTHKCTHIHTHQLRERERERERILTPSPWQYNAHSLRAGNSSRRPRAPPKCQRHYLKGTADWAHCLGREKVIEIERETQKEESELVELYRTLTWCVVGHN